MLSRLEEFRLISRCVLADDRAAFGALVEAYQGRMRRFFMNLTMGNAALSDDLAQDTFVKAYLNLRSFKGLAGFGTWLYRIGYNEFYNQSRRIAELGEDAITAACEPVTNTATETEQSIDVQTLMRSLNEQERVVVTLFYLHDVEIKKISTITSMPVGTVKSHLSRAKAKMSQVAQAEGITA